jgi:hypothetical protein
MVYLLKWVLQLNGADNQIISDSLENSDKLLSWQESALQYISFLRDYENCARAKERPLLLRG